MRPVFRAAWFFPSFFAVGDEQLSLLPFMQIYGILGGRPAGSRQLHEMSWTFCGLQHLLCVEEIACKSICLVFRILRWLHLPKTSGEIQGAAKIPDEQVVADFVGDGEPVPAIAMISPLIYVGTDEDGVLQYVIVGMNLLPLFPVFFVYNLPPEGWILFWQVVFQDSQWVELLQGMVTLFGAKYLGQWLEVLSPEGWGQGLYITFHVLLP